MSFSIVLLQTANGAVAVGLHLGNLMVGLSVDPGASAAADGGRMLVTTLCVGPLWVRLYLNL